MPDKIKNYIGLALGIIAELFFDGLNLLRQAITISTIVLHLFGKISTLILLFLAIAIFLNESFYVLGFGKFWSGGKYEAWLELLTKPYTWASATTIVAGTVAIVHLRRLELDLQNTLKTSGIKFKNAQRKDVKSLKALATQ